MNWDFETSKFEERIKMVEDLIKRIESNSGTGNYLKGYDHQSILQLIQLSAYFRIFLVRHSKGEIFSPEDINRIKDFETDFDNLINLHK